jgi:hypothetical protein
MLRLQVPSNKLVIHVGAQLAELARPQLLEPGALRGLAPAEEPAGWRPAVGEVRREARHEDGAAEELEHRV